MSEGGIARSASAPTCRPPSATPPAQRAHSLLALKLGAPSADLEARVRARRPEDLERWAERVLSATTLEDVLAD